MFPTAGYFRNLPCPFYIHGLCHRPYCHFRHSKPDKKAKRDSSIDWTYGEVVDSAAGTSTGNDDDIMKIIKNISPGKKIAGSEAKNETEKKAVSFALFKPYAEYDGKQNGKGKGEKPKNDGGIKYEDTISDPIPIPIVKDITELLQITNVTDQSAEIAVAVKNRKKHSKKDKQDAEKKEEEETPTREGKKAAKSSEGIINDNGFEILEPAKPPKLKDVSFFAPDSPKKINIKRKRKRLKEERKSKYHDTASSSESSSESVDNSEDTLRRIFEDYDPVSAATDATVDDEVEIVYEKRQLKTTVHGEPDYIPVSCMETVGAGSIKKRVAHNANVEVFRQPLSRKSIKRGPSRPSYISPSARAASADHGKETNAAKVEVPSVTSRMSFTTEGGVYIGKKRKSHTITEKKETANCNGFSAAARPRIPMQFGSKVPQVIRQRYLDRIIDEYVTKAGSLQDVYDKAVEDEDVVYNRCTSKQIYMNLCVNAIKRIRSLPDVLKKKSGNPMESAKSTVTSVNNSYIRIASQIACPTAPPKKVIRPSTIALASLEKKHSSLLAEKNTMLVKKRKSSINCLPEVTESLFYENMLTYLASEQDLWDNNYPKESKGKTGQAIVKDQKQAAHPTKRTCARCGKTFFLDLIGDYVSTEECHYHWGRLRRMRDRGEVLTQFSCCKGDAASIGCSVGKLHVSENAGIFDGYVMTKINPTKNTRKVFALDCEMCYTVNGLELSRVTVVDYNMTQVYDTFVKPDRPVIDYNTRFSGVSEKSLRNVRTSLQDIQNKLLEMFGKDTILVGHSLESDLRAMKIIHYKVVDTALVFPHRLGLPYKRALKTLMGEFMQKIIQDSDGGHDSYEDSASCMELMKWKITEDLKKQARTVNAHVR